MKYVRHPVYTNYLVSDSGQVRHETSDKDRAQRMDRYGYMRVNLSGPYRKHTTVAVHRLVAETHIGPVQSGFSVNHKDGDKQNNRASNLEIVTKAQNVTHSFKSGLRVHQRCTPFVVNGTVFYSKREAERVTGIPRWKMQLGPHIELDRKHYP